MKPIALLIAFCAVCGAAFAQENDTISTVQQAQDTLAAAQAEPQPYCKYKTATYGQARAMAFLLKREANDNKRLKLGKKYISNYLLTAEQLGWLADTFADDAKRAKFLKKAKKHCSEQQPNGDIVPKAKSEGVQ